MSRNRTFGLGKGKEATKFSEHIPPFITPPKRGEGGSMWVLRRDGVGGLMLPYLFQARDAACYFRKYTGLEGYTEHPLTVLTLYDVKCIIAGRKRKRKAEAETVQSSS